MGIKQTGRFPRPAAVPRLKQEWLDRRNNVAVCFASKLGQWRGMRHAPMRLSAAVKPDLDPAGPVAQL